LNVFYFANIVHRKMKLVKEKEYECPFRDCGRSYTRKSQLKAHLLKIKGAGGNEVHATDDATWKEAQPILEIVQRPGLTEMEKKERTKISQEKYRETNREKLSEKSKKRRKELQLGTKLTKRLANVAYRNLHLDDYRTYADYQNQTIHELYGNDILAADGPTTPEKLLGADYPKSTMLTFPKLVCIFLAARHWPRMVTQLSYKEGISYRLLDQIPGEPQYQLLCQVFKNNTNTEAEEQEIGGNQGQGQGRGRGRGQSHGRGRGRGGQRGRGRGGRVQNMDNQSATSSNPRETGATDNTKLQALLHDSYNQWWKPVVCDARLQEFYFVHHRDNIDGLINRNFYLEDVFTRLKHWWSIYNDYVHYLAPQNISLAQLRDGYNRQRNEMSDVFAGHMGNDPEDEDLNDVNDELAGIARLSDVEAIKMGLSVTAKKKRGRKCEMEQLEESAKESSKQLVEIEESADESMEADESEESTSESDESTSESDESASESEEPDRLE
jgi:hypothetical protein